MLPIGQRAGRQVTGGVTAAREGRQVLRDALHHTLEGYLAEYIERAQLGEAGRAPLFQAIKVRPYGRGEAVLNGERLHRTNAWQMVRRRAKAAGIATEVCNHTFRGTGITAYLENGGTAQDYYTSCSIQRGLSGS
jgi:integrase